LIIFFLVTSVFSAARGLALELPADDDGQRALAVEAVFIQVAADGGIRVDCHPMGLDGILAYLEPRLRRNPDKPVILHTDAGATYQSMISVYDVLGSARQETHGFEVRHLSVPTEREVRDYIAMFGLNPFESHCGP
jgi:biopolymer transport protein ExbD